MQKTGGKTGYENLLDQILKTFLVPFAKTDLPALEARNRKVGSRLGPASHWMRYVLSCVPVARQETSDTSSTGAEHRVLLTFNKNGSCEITRFFETFGPEGAV